MVEKKNYWSWGNNTIIRFIQWLQIVAIELSATLNKSVLKKNFIDLQKEWIHILIEEM